MSTEEKIAALRAAYLTDRAHRFDHYMTLVESPIERLLLAQMFNEGWGQASVSRSWHDAWVEARDLGFWPQPIILQADVGPCMCILQANVPGIEERYRIDFAFVGERIEKGEVTAQIRVAVELDGHEFHERTKEQASRDKRRDRVLAANGWVVLRFTGSDVYRDPAAVLEEINRTCTRLCYPWMPEYDK